mmetsp:Transcript_1081/g.3803  ORF Transcript_1081/g.3803 Transcript_1081/m.3803 type:complete len:1058 (+) Transcript_1081:206-3379(+)
MSSTSNSTIKLEVGEVLWVKVTNIPWWPAKVCNPEDCPPEILDTCPKDEKVLCKFFGDYDYFWVLPGSRAVRRFRCSQYTELAKAAPGTERYDAIVQALQWEGSRQQNPADGREAPPASEWHSILKASAGKKPSNNQDLDKVKQKPNKKTNVLSQKASAPKAEVEARSGPAKPSAPKGGALSAMDKLLLLSDAVCTMLDEEKKPSSSKSKRKKHEDYSEDDEDDTGVRRSKRALKKPAKLQQDEPGDLPGVPEAVARALMGIDAVTYMCSLCKEECGSEGEAGRRAVICNVCGRRVHLQCADDPPLHKFPSGGWVCSGCRQCHTCGSRSAGSGASSKWMRNFTLCNACGRLYGQGKFCPLCDKVYRDSDYETPMLCCESCEKWVHAHCEGMNEEEYKAYEAEDKQYYCPMCRVKREERRRIAEAARYEALKKSETLKSGKEGAKKKSKIPGSGVDKAGVKKGQGSNGIEHSGLKRKKDQSGKLQPGQTGPLKNRKRKDGDETGKKKASKDRQGIPREGMPSSPDLKDMSQVNAMSMFMGQPYPPPHMMMPGQWPQPGSPSPSGPHGGGPGQGPGSGGMYPPFFMQGFPPHMRPPTGHSTPPIPPPQQRGTPQSSGQNTTTQNPPTSFPGMPPFPGFDPSAAAAFGWSQLPAPPRPPPTSPMQPPLPPFRTPAYPAGFFPFAPPFGGGPRQGRRPLPPNRMPRMHLEQYWQAMQSGGPGHPGMPSPQGGSGQYMGPLWQVKGEQPEGKKSQPDNGRPRKEEKPVDAPQQGQPGTKQPSNASSKPPTPRESQGGAPKHPKQPSMLGKQAPTPTNKSSPSSKNSGALHSPTMANTKPAKPLTGVSKTAPVGAKSGSAGFGDKRPPLANNPHQHSQTKPAQQITSESDKDLNKGKATATAVAKPKDSSSIGTDVGTNCAAASGKPASGAPMPKPDPEDKLTAKPSVLEDADVEDNKKELSTNPSAAAPATTSTTPPPAPSEGLATEPTPRAVPPVVNGEKSCEYTAVSAESPAPTKQDIIMAPPGTSPALAQQRDTHAPETGEDQGLELLKAEPEALPKEP